MTTERLEAFSDGVFAVAITLLAWDLKLQALSGPVTEGALLQALAALWPKFFTYVMTFILVGMFWIAHHRIFESIERVDRWLLWLNTILLLWVCLLPLSAATYSTYIDTHTGVIIYGVNVMLVGVALFCVWHYAVTRGLLGPGTDGALIRAAYRRILVGIPMYLLAIGVSFVSPRLSGLVYVAALAMYLLPAQVDNYYSRK